MALDDSDAVAELGQPEGEGVACDAGADDEDFKGWHGGLSLVRLRLGDRAIEWDAWRSVSGDVGAFVFSWNWGTSALDRVNGSLATLRYTEETESCD